MQTIYKRPGGIYKRYTNDIQTAWGEIQTIYKRYANDMQTYQGEMQTICKVYAKYMIVLMCVFSAAAASFTISNINVALTDVLLQKHPLGRTLPRKPCSRGCRE